MSRPIAGLQAAYYARIVPVLGAGLGEKRIAVCGVAAVAGAVERLAGCRALHWWIADDRPLAAADPLVRGFGAPAGAPAGPALAALLQAHNTWEAGWAFRHYPALTAASYAMLAAAWQPDPPDLLLGGGDLPALVLLARLGRALNRPILLVAHCAGADPAAACLALLPGDAGQGRDLPDLLAALGAPPVYDPAALPPDGASWPAWAETNGLAALLAKALLTHGTPLADPALDSLLWSAHRTAAVIGTAPWPWTVQHVDLARAGRRPGDSRQSSVVSRQSSVVSRQSSGQAGSRQSAVGRDDAGAGAGNPPGTPGRWSLVTGHWSLVSQSKIQNPKSKIRCAVIVGCGSLGSLVARGLVASGAVGRLVLVDGEAVEATNPVRQYFHTGQVGEPKVEALAQNLAALGAPGRAGTWTAVVAQLADSRAGRAAFRRLLRANRPDVVVLTTGSHVDYALARVARRLGIPHLVGRCYPRARYFEAIVVDGRRGPCFGCLRGHLYTGPAPLPTPEEALRYARPAAAGELQAEPATVVESGRAADVLAHLAAALAQPRRMRAPWLAAWLASEQTCLIGGNTAQPVRDATTEQPGWAYGVQYPGQVVAFGAAQVLGTGTAQVCADCGRQLAVVYPIAGDIAPALGEGALLSKI